MEDKRKYQRVETNLKSEVHSEEGMTYSTSSDMSRGGIFIMTPEPLHTGSEVALRLRLPGQKEVEIRGVVRWIQDGNNEGEKSGMGIEFTDDNGDTISDLSGVLP